MLSKRLRLSSSRDIEKLWKKGFFVCGKNMGIRFLKNKDEKKRVVVVVGTKISKFSTRRNLIRRRIQEVMRQQFIGQLKNVDLIIIVFGGILKLTYKQILEELEVILKKANLLQKDV